jgi:hypothetical protein
MKFSIEPLLDHTLQFPAMPAVTPFLFARRNIDISQAFCYKTTHVKGGLS